MIIIMHPEAGPAQIDNVVAAVEAKGWQTHLSVDYGQTVIGVAGRGQPLDAFLFGQMPGVLDTMAVTRKFKLASRAFCPENTVFQVGNVTVGGERLVDRSRPMHRGESPAVAGNGAGCQRGRRLHAPRRRLQATYIPL